MDSTQLTDHVRAAFGTACHLESLDRLAGGARKQIYRARLRDPSLGVLVYLWHNEAGYFADRERAGFEDTQTDEQAPLLFDATVRFLANHRVSVPEVLHRGRLDSGHQVAFVEEIVGEPWTAFAPTASPSERAQAREALGAEVGRLHSIHRSWPGIPDPVVEAAALSPERVAERTRWELMTLAGANLEIAVNRERVEVRLQELVEAIKPRPQFTLVHGELPHHLLVRHADRRLFLVDVEGVQFADVEIDHIQCRLFLAPEDYEAVARDDLDPDRMSFYGLCWHISAAYAGSRLVAGGFPDQVLARQIYEHNVRRSLELCLQGPTARS